MSTRRARTVVNVPDWIATKMSRESRAFVFRVMVDAEARERATTRERAMNISARELDINQILEELGWYVPVARTGRDLLYSHHCFAAVCIA